jgi:hypothetical protein
MPSVSIYFTCHAGIMNMHDLLLLIGLVFELLHQQVHLGRQHVYLLELMYTFTSLAGLNTIFSTRAVAAESVSDKKAPPTAASIVAQELLVNPW